MQFDMFSQGLEDQHNLKVELISKDGQTIYYPDFFSGIDFELLKEEICWSADKITLYGKTHDIPRLQAWYGDHHYSYSGIKLKPLEWTPLLLSIKNEIESRLGLEFNSCLCNLYRHGKDYVAWHSDDEPELGKNPTIASASFGETRKIVFKHRFDKGVEKVEKELIDNSLVLMKGKLQHFWRHQINKTSKNVGERINLTFRLINP